MNEIELSGVINPDTLAVEISNQWFTLNQSRSSWLEEKQELRNYLYATDTKTTANSILPWSNSTTTPKLTQIMDNLHANYFSTLFPRQQWMKFEAFSEDAAVKEKRETIQAYMDTKLRQSNFVNTMSDLLYDWIQYGNCFTLVEWEQKYLTNEANEVIIDYIGPKAVRISPHDIVFDATASDFGETRKIIRSLKTLGEVKRMVLDNPDNAFLQSALDRSLAARATVLGGDDKYKDAGFVADGFGSIREYYNSDYVEILTFYGSVYNKDTQEYQTDRIITVMDRSYVLENKENPSWLGNAPIFHAGWRDRPDNLYSMGPLDNLVGMQYRIDHLENLKADVFDQIAYPILKIKGDVEDFDFQPNARIYLGEEGDVNYLAPDGTALQADMQIAILEAKMEEMAGAPKQAMGIRTAGEKTAFEVQTLHNASSRIFEHKTGHFERVFVENILNSMLEMARRNLNQSDVIRTIDSQYGIELFKEVDKDDISASGKIVPVGARHFAERARRVQNLNQLYQIKLADPSVSAHLSGKEFAKILSEELGEPSLYSENIAVQEALETTEAQQESEMQNQENLQMKQELGI